MKEGRGGEGAREGRSEGGKEAREGRKGMGWGAWRYAAELGGVV